MIIEKNLAQPKMDKLAKENDTFSFALSVDGYLLVRHGKVFSVSDYWLFCNNQSYRHHFVSFSSTQSLPSGGLFIGTYGRQKFFAPRLDDVFEYASQKKALSSDFCAILLMQFSGRLVLFIADGQFTDQAVMITLADTDINDKFTKALARKLVSAHNPEAAAWLFANQEEDDDGIEEE